MRRKKEALDGRQGGRKGGLLKGGMERGLEAESTSFSRYNRGECTVRNEQERETGKGYREAGIREGEGGEGEGGGAGATRKKCGIRDFVCLPVRPSEPEGTSAAANLEGRTWQRDEYLCGETTGREREGDSTNSRIG